MKILFFLLLCYPSFAFSCMAQKIESGDTFQCDKNIVIIKGIDAPEEKQFYFIEAKDRLKQMIEGQDVAIDSDKKDMYGRVVSKVFLDDVDIGKGLVREGYVWTDQSSDQYLPKNDDYFLELTEAMNNKRGLWDKSTIAPWIWKDKYAN